MANAQKLISVAALLLATAWAFWAFSNGHPLLAVAGLALLSTVHALVLGVEFALMARANASDPAPRAELPQHVRAWVQEALYAPRVFCWRQPFRSGHEPDHLPTEPVRRGVLLVHGFFCNRGLWIEWMARLRRQAVPCIAVDLSPVLGSIDDYLATIEEAVTALEQATGLPPVILAHSMGGLVIRKWWSQPSSAGRVHRLITLGTPHRGTWLARFAVSANGRQMRIASDWLRALQAMEPAGHAARTICFYSHCDNIVFPASTATLPGADNRHLAAASHVHMIERPEPFEELIRQLA